MTEETAPRVTPPPKSNRPGAQHAPPVDFGDWRAQMRKALDEGGPPARRKAFLLVSGMVLGSILMWIGMPFGWLWLASHLQQGVNPSLGPYMLMAIGLPVSLVIIGKGLGSLDRQFSELIRHDPNDRRVPLPWAKSVRDASGGRKGTFLDLVMIISVGVTGTLFGIWFVFFAHATLPGA
jgi:hypothetical protein